MDWTDEEIHAWAQAIGLTAERVPGGLSQRDQDTGWWTVVLRLDGREWRYGGMFGWGLPTEVGLPSAIRSMASTYIYSQMSQQDYVDLDPDEPRRDQEWVWEQEWAVRDREFLGSYYEAVGGIWPIY